MYCKLRQDFSRLLSAPYGRLAAFGILLIPFDSAWFFPLDTVYRPAWIMPFLIIGVFRLYNSFRLLRVDLTLILIVFYSLFSTLIATLYFSYPDLLGVKKMIIVVTVATLGVIGINYFLNKLSQKFGHHKSLKILASSIVVSSFLPMFIGFLQIPGEFLGMYEINQVISSVFSYRYTPGRIHLLSGEPSWAARYILFVMIMSLFVDVRSIGYIRAALCILLFFTGSALGYFTGLLLTIFYLFVNLKISLFSMTKVLGFIFSFAILFFNYSSLLSFSPYAVDKVDRIFNLSSNISMEHIMTIAAIDGSILARIINPIISFDLALSYPLGIGGESFKFWVIEKIYDYGYAGSSSDEYILASGSTPKFLISKIMVEHGLLFFIALSVLFVRLYRGIKNPNLKFLLLSVPVMTLSDDSYLFYGLILPICIASMLNKKNI